MFGRKNIIIIAIIAGFLLGLWLYACNWWDQKIQDSKNWDGQSYINETPQGTMLCSLMLFHPLQPGQEAFAWALQHPERFTPIKVKRCEGPIFTVYQRP